MENAIVNLDYFQGTTTAFRAEMEFGQTENRDQMGRR
jgi:hypothetical protein